MVEGDGEAPGCGEGAGAGDDERFVFHSAYCFVGLREIALEDFVEKGWVRELWVSGFRLAFDFDDLFFACLGRR